jgi:hypothetical protein
VTLELDTAVIHPPEDVADEDELINDVTLDLSAATIEAEAVEFDEAAAQERVPHAESASIDAIAPGVGVGVNMNGTATGGIVRGW